jgi:hypothetical protein
MRNHLACLATLVLATSPLVTTQIADACGGYEAFQRAPQALTVTRHVRGGEAPNWTARSFALLGEVAYAKDAKWSLVSRGTYDNAQVAPLGRLSSPITVTLLGSHGPRVVKAQRHVALAYPMFQTTRMFQTDKTFDAIELPLRSNEVVEVALVGDYSDATWHSISYRYTREQGINDTNLMFESTYKDGAAYFELRDGDRKLGTHLGSVEGAVEIAGIRYIVATNGGTARLIRA